MASTGSDDRVALQSCDGSEPGAYRRWKRRAHLLLAAFPKTDKLGPRLMPVIKGEAEQLCELIPVEDLCSKGADFKVFKLPDGKYGPWLVDLLHTALKTFFYELMIKPSEAYQEFVARFAKAVRLLRAGGQISRSGSWLHVLEEAAVGCAERGDAVNSNEGRDEAGPDRGCREGSVPEASWLHPGEAGGWQ